MKHFFLMAAVLADVADTREKVRDRIGHGHVYQLAFFTPGISPREARFRKQIRQILNFL